MNEKHIYEYIYIVIYDQQHSQLFEEIFTLYFLRKHSKFVEIVTIWKLTCNKNYILAKAHTGTNIFYLLL